MSRDDAYAAYRDENDEPILTESCVLFFDVLGTSAMSQAKDAVEQLRKLRPALEHAVDRADTEDPIFTRASTWFTDNAVVGAPLVAFEVREGVVGGLEVSAAYLLLVCWGYGFLGRGAITYGPHYMDPQFVFGPALIEAVELEKAARWPRVVLSPTAIAKEQEHSRYYSHPLRSVQNSCLTRDQDGIVFVDHLGIYIDEEDDEATLDHFLSLHRRATEGGLAANPQGTKVWDKWRWLAEYQNFALASRLRDPEPYLVEIGEQRYEFGDFLDPAFGTTPGSPWWVLDRQDRYRVDAWLRDFVPAGPAVYAFYRDEVRQYVGEATNLESRMTRNHLRRTPSMRDSALRRNVSELLGIASAADIATGRYVPSEADAQRVWQWLSGCEVAWQACDSKSDAVALEVALRAQHCPPLNRR